MSLLVELEEQSPEIASGVWQDKNCDDTDVRVHHGRDAGVFAAHPLLDARYEQDQGLEAGPDAVVGESGHQDPGHYF